MSSIKIKYLTRGDKIAGAARETFQLAMHDDALARYLAKDATYRRFWDLMISHYLTSTNSKLNFVTEGLNAGVLARIYPDEKASFFSNLIYSLRILPCFPIQKWKAGLALDEVMVKGKDNFGKEHGSFIYIFLLGTRPEHQGKGLGGALLQHISHIADSSDMHCWLEASSEGSRRLYKRHGYVDRETFYAAADAPPLYLMSRAPVKITANSCRDPAQHP